MNPVVRAGVPDDAVAVATAHITAWQHAYRGIVPDTHLDGLDLDERTKRWRGILAGEIPSVGGTFSVTIVAERDGAVVGFACVGPDRNALDELERGELWSIYVHPDHWGSGAGPALLDDAMSRLGADGRQVATLWVLVDNARARRFYESFGWRPTERFEQIEIDGESIYEVAYEVDLVARQERGT